MSHPVATISVFSAVGASPGFRDSAAHLFSDVEESIREVVLDFDNVVFISRGFADELHQVRQMVQSERGLTIVVENANEEVRAMLNVVSRTQDGAGKSNKPLSPIHINGSQGLEDLLLGM